MPRSVKRWKICHICSFSVNVCDKTLLQTRAQIVATQENIHGLKASKGFIQKFIRRSSVQRSLLLHGKGGSALPYNHVEMMKDVQDTSASCSHRNIYYMDEARIFKMMGSRRSYLSANEVREDARSTELQKNKNRMTMVLALNADGSHMLPMKYVGSSTELRCFRYTQIQSP